MRNANETTIATLLMPFSALKSNGVVLKRKLIHKKKILIVILVDEKCPIGYSGKAPDCYDIDRSKDSQFYQT